MAYKKYHWWMNKNKNGNRSIDTGVMKSLFFIFSILISCSFYSQAPDPKNAQELITRQYNNFNLKGIDPDINEVKKLIKQSDQLDFTEGTLRGLIMLQRLAIRKGDYKLADNYTEQAENIAHHKGYDYKLTAAYFNKANAYLKLKMYKEAKAMVDKAMTIAQTNPDKIDRQLWISQKYSFLAGVAAEFNKHDSIAYYTQKSLATVEAIPTKNLTEHQKIIYYHFLIFQLMNMGISCTESTPPKTDLAEFYFKKALSYSTTQPQYFKRAGMEVYESVSNFYFEQKDYAKAIEYSKKVLELEKTNRKVEERLLALGRLKDTYGILKNAEEERKYLKLYTELKDSTDNVERKAIVNDARNQISKSKKEVAAEYNEDRKNIFLVSAGAIVLIIIAAWQYSMYGKRKYRQKYDQLISKLNSENSVQEPEIEKKETIYNNSIYSETEQKLLRKLQAFEASDKFLKPEISMNLLASHFKTNATYLSKIINKSKNQNFNNYINSLRINYITNKLYNEKKYREYKISYLAEECGYASTQVFVIAFKNEHGVPPSYFIKQLKSDSGTIESTDDKVTDLSV